MDAFLLSKAIKILYRGKYSENIVRLVIDTLQSSNDYKIQSQSLLVNSSYNPDMLELLAELKILDDKDNTYLKYLSYLRDELRNNNVLCIDYSRLKVFKRMYEEQGRDLNHLCLSYEKIEQVTPFNIKYDNGINIYFNNYDTLAALYPGFKLQDVINCAGYAGKNFNSLVRKSSISEDDINLLNHHYYETVIDDVDNHNVMIRTNNNKNKKRY